MQRAICIVASLVVALSTSACGTADPGPDTTPDGGTSEADAGVDAGTPPIDEPITIPQRLSELGLFAGPPGADGTLTPVTGNLPYELNATLFSDYAAKHRTVRIPDGKAAQYQPSAVLDFPVGTILTKTFSYPADLRAPTSNVRVVETRILVRQPTGWEAWPYYWNEAQTEATLAPGGRVTKIHLTDLEGESRTFDYLVPSKNQCLQCHHLQDGEGRQVMRPIGPKARYLNRTNTYDGVEANQLEHLAALGKLQGLPANDVPRAPNPFDAGAATLDARARAYLDINCAHCHNAEGTAGITSRLYLDSASTNEFNLGACKRPGSAGSEVGGTFDIVPGDHTQSILWFRLQTEESGKMMPQLGRTISHREGSQLIADWIDAMTPRTCD